MCQNWWVKCLKLEGSTTNLHLDNLHPKKKNVKTYIKGFLFKKKREEPTNIGNKLGGKIMNVKEQHLFYNNIVF
jgi:hypothetical protein